MVDFSQARLRGAPAARFEVDVHDCEITGDIPKDLDGALYRMHLDWLYPPVESRRDHSRGGWLHQLVPAEGRPRALQGPLRSDGALPEAD